MALELDVQAPFVPASEEDSYLQRHGMAIYRLPNGITMLSVSHLDEDTVSAEIEISMATGASNDPPGKSGSHHLLEHLAVIPDLERKASNLGVYFGARTSSSEFTLELEGIANPKVRTYGVYPIISGLRGVMVRHLGNYEDLEKPMSIHKKVVRREIAENSSDPNQMELEYRLSTLYAPSNPYRVNIGGTFEDLEGITVEDLMELARQVFITDQTTITIATRGESSINQPLADEIHSQFATIDPSSVKARGIDKSLFGLLNPDFQMGKIYRRTSPVRDNIRAVELLWLSPIRSFSPEDAALRRFAKIIGPHVYSHVRDQGWSYSPGVSATSEEENAFLSIVASLENRSDIDSFVRTVLIPSLKLTLSSLPDSEFVADEYERLRYDAVPVSKSNRSHHFLSGWSRYRRIIDADRIKELYMQVNLDHLRLWRDRILDQDPAVIIY